MKLSIITINLNNVEGLRRTMESVFCQTSNEFEYIVVDGDSVDGSKDIIYQFDNKNKHSFKWLSEKDNGIYQAMNKGIQMATGDFIQFLNSGDFLVATDVTERMLKAIPEGCNIFYGNMLKKLPKRIYHDRGFAGRKPTMLDFYSGTLNHSPAYIRRSLFKMFGLYDESLKIVSDWKWYLQVIGLNGIVPVYKDIDVTFFDMNGISTINSDLDQNERKQVLLEILPASVLTDYEQWFQIIDQIVRINRYGLTRKVFWLVERLLFKLEKWFGYKTPYNKEY
jgi:glycosyltransferase involved in cell wall biosynthesis